MKRFVMRQNIEHYRALLDVTTDPSCGVRLSSCFTTKKPNLKNTTTITRKNRPAPARRLNQSRFSSSGSLAIVGGDAPGLITRQQLGGRVASLIALTLH